MIQQWISNGTDFLTNEFIGSFNDFRLYPTELSTEEDGLTYYKYQMGLSMSNGEPITGDPWSYFNDHWLQVDALQYNNLATTAFIIGFDTDGIVQTVGSQALRSTMDRSAE